MKWNELKDGTTLVWKSAVDDDYDVIVVLLDTTDFYHWKWLYLNDDFHISTGHANFGIIPKEWEIFLP